MNKKHLKSLLSNLNQKFRTLPGKYKYLAVTASGIAVLTVTVLFASTASPHIENTPLSSTDISADTSANTTYKAESFSAKAVPSQESDKPSRGKVKLNPIYGDIIKLGVNNTIVMDIQKKLMDLDYIESDEPSEEFGEAMDLAVKLFQRKNELEINGQVDAKTYECLMSDKAKAYTVYLGAEGTDVEQLQSRLYELGYLPKITGYFGTDTETAVKQFQKRNGLFGDGNVGKNTREILYSDRAIPLSFYLGDVDDEILKYQKKLIELGYLTTKPDGKYGNDTVRAVKLFQDNNALIADGHMGPATKELLMSGQGDEYAIKTGDSGVAVTNIQKYLEKLGYINKSTGYFGSDTLDAVVNFQKYNGLSSDGKVGSKTISKLLSPDAKRWKGNPFSGGNSGGGGSSGGSSSGGSNIGNIDTGSSSSSIVNAIISSARSKMGSRYVYGAKGPNSFDCSGFVYYVLNKAGIKQSYMTSYSWQSNRRYQKITSMSSIKRGDIISYRGHVGIALGNNQMIDASPSAGKVRITSITSSYWVRNFVCAYRIF